MKECSSCGGGHVRAVRRARRRYELRGLRDIILHDIPVESCPQCRHAEIAAGDMEELRHAIASTIIAKRQRLMPREIRFLRRHLGLSGVALAAHLGATPESVSRWEHGRTPIGVTTDRLLRLIVVVAQRTNYPLKTLRTVAHLEPSATTIHVRRREERWVVSTQDRESLEIFAVAPSVRDDAEPHSQRTFDDGKLRRAERSERAN